MLLPNSSCASLSTLARHGLSGRRRGQIYDFASSRIILGDDEIEGRENIGEVRPRNRHGLHAGKIKRAIGPNQEEARFGKQGRLLDSGRCRAPTGRDVKAPPARDSKIKPVAEPQVCQFPIVLCALGALGGVGRYCDHAHAAFRKFR